MTRPQLFFSPFKYKGVLFDLDGTLYHKKHLNLRMALAHLGSLSTLKKHQATRDELAGMSGEKDYLSLYQQLMADKGVKNPKLWLEKQFYPNFIRCLKKQKVRPSLNLLLDLLKEKGIKTAVVSDYPIISERLASLTIDASKFDLLLSTQDINCLKPCPTGYLEAVKRLGLQKEDCLIIGDRMDRDGEAAEKADIDYAIICEEVPVLANHYRWIDLFSVLRRAILNQDIDKTMREKYL
jgi:beta-phosphoglucomutase